MTTAMLKDMDPFVWKLARKGAIDDDLTTAAWVSEAIKLYYHNRDKLRIEGLIPSPQRQAILSVKNIMESVGRKGV